MATNEVDSETTVPNPESSRVTTEQSFLESLRLLLKLCEMLLSLLTFFPLMQVKTGSCEGSLFLLGFICSIALQITPMFVLSFATTLHPSLGIGYSLRLDLAFTTLMAQLYGLASVIIIIDHRSSSNEIVVVALSFLTTSMYCLDAGLLLKNNGIPWKRVSDDGGPVYERMRN